LPPPVPPPVITVSLISILGAAAVENLFVDMDDNGNGFVDHTELCSSLVRH